MSRGDEKVWEILASLNADKLCSRTGASFDAPAGLYTLRSFGYDFDVSPDRREILGRSPASALFLQKLGYFFRLSVLGYLALGKDVAPTGRLIKPTNMRSGQLFFRGSHALPLERVAERYGRDRQGFLGRVAELGGTALEYGDAAVEVLPLPRVPVVLVLWMEDDEFPSRIELLFDTSSETQLPIDVIWSVAMLTTLAML